MSERLVMMNQRARPTFKWWVQDVVDAVLHYPSYLVERHIYERPSARYRKMLIRVTGFDKLAADCEILSRDGVLILPGYFTGEPLQQMQQDYNRWCELKSGSDRYGFKDFDGGKQESYLATSYSMSKVAVGPYLTALVSYYWGKPIRLAYCHGYRLDPIEPQEYRAFRWHHDLKRKQVRVMVLLTDTPVEGQRMDYIAGSHRVWHRFTNHRQCRFTEEEARSYGSPIHCVGPAGTVVLFDANGIHRGNRNLGSRRDQYTFNYTAGRALFPLPGLHPEVVKQLTDRQRRMVRIDDDSRNLWTRFRHWITDRYFLRLW
ncbi:MAG: phytanoyl-CoA dioxygenase family protein [Candidatus Andersenbacteria bacterium]|nr:phytanoyl-CoA dioxygenase family protein [Candidatus Andersenbacteria bacterium]MBI3251113.1 phytanoyl-CoA dioxygenase family protein [Candidatus Andersenbacteria bacterium]